MLRGCRLLGLSLLLGPRGDDLRTSPARGLLLGGTAASAGPLSWLHHLPAEESFGLGEFQTSREYCQPVKAGLQSVCWLVILCCGRQDTMSSVLPWVRAWPRPMVSAVQALCLDLAQPGQSSVGPALLSQQQRLAAPDLAAASGRLAAAAPVMLAVQGWQSPVTGCLGQPHGAAVAGWLAAAGLWFPGYCSPPGNSHCLASCWCDPMMQQPASEKPVERELLVAALAKWQSGSHGGLPREYGHLFSTTLPLPLFR